MCLCLTLRMASHLSMSVSVFDLSKIIPFIENDMLYDYV